MRPWALARRLADDPGLHAPFLTAAALLMFLGRPGSFVAQNYDGAYYAQKAKEMLATGSVWVVPYHGEPTFDNAPLPFWLMGLSFRVFGVSEYAAVVPTALFGLLTVLLTRRIALALTGDARAGLLAGLILLFPGFFVDYARRPMADVVLTGWVTAAMLCFARGLERPAWLLGFGLCTGLAMLTKSVLGLFPLGVALAYGLAARRLDLLRSPLLWAAAALALGVGSSWYAASWARFGAEFWDTHFGWLIVERGLRGPRGSDHPSDSLYALGYLRLLAGTYWPWLPLAAIGVWQTARRARRNPSEPGLLPLVWLLVPLVVLSASPTQMLRYLLQAFPALALLSAGAAVGWAPLRGGGLLGPALVLATAGVALFVALTPIGFGPAVSLSERGRDAKALAPIVRLNTSPRDEVGNYKLAAWNPRNAMLFYADRFVADPVEDPVELVLRLQESPSSTWLTRAPEFDRLDEQFPGLLYLIQSSGRYAYFTSARGATRIRYDRP